MAHLVMIPLAIGAYFFAAPKAGVTVYKQQTPPSQILPEGYPKFLNGHAENYWDVRPILDEWESGETWVPWQRWRGLPWGEQRRRVYQEYFGRTRAPLEWYRQERRDEIGGFGGPDPQIS